jgi:hypothetical protein
MMNEPEPFAVDLSNDGIFLWHKKPAKKWEFLGSVPLNSGNLRQQLESLKQTVLGIDAPSNAAIVRIPVAEVKTFTLSPDPDGNTRWETRIMSSLEAAAGMPIKQLAFDIERGQATSDICVAWTPMTVIHQAETFVHLIGFKPTHYTTDLDIADFPRNPRFEITDYQPVPDENIPDIEHTQTVIPEPAAPFELPKNEQPAITPKKGDIYLWVIALLLIISLLTAAFYYWPRTQKSAYSEPVSFKNSYIMPAHQSPRAIHFEKG